ncbi:NUDIX domain-containing protein [Nonomuraea sp. MCN248]|uniref:NUDIX domain-containing protein n=1 Tax=Nonomuraea corallina TaxID=2989783 RepID=A0ABT4SCA8_9ACTN|nr:NUDIX domain-containing protein [Nonomuraea corallina]MDA0634683.1 NUDIX domain-containing protein [Nonomuraea corallina]
MPMSPYLAGVRAKLGPDLLMMPSVCGCVFDDEGRLLVARHGDVGLWAAPGGALDPDERPEEAVRRELREELGIEVRVRGLIGVHSGPEFRVRYPNGHECLYMIAVYGCAIESGTPTPDGDEIREARWVREDELDELAMTPWSPRVLPGVFAWWRAQVS